jgi:hypothetical protein
MDTKEFLKSLEIELLQYETRHNPARINELIADDFLEYGSSGKSFGKKEALESLPKEEGVVIQHSDMEARMISESIGQVLFKTSIQKDSAPPKVALRSSLWRKTESWWQMFFHQGTLISKS